MADENEDVLRLRPPDNHHGSAAAASTISPLLSLLDSVLSRDDARITEAVQSMQDLLQNNNTNDDKNNDVTDRLEPCTSTATLCRILSLFLSKRPEMAAEPSDYDGSLPLHFCASLGKVSVANIVLQAVRRNEKR
jgi:hypothetical protein